MTLTQILQKIRSAFYTKAETDATYLKDITNSMSRKLLLIKGDGTSTEVGVEQSYQAEHAQKDWNGNNIIDTYATKTELNSKANNSDVVHKGGAETIVGPKTFSSWQIINMGLNVKWITGNKEQKALHLFGSMNDKYEGYGSVLELHGDDANYGMFTLIAKDKTNTNVKRFVGLPDGTLTWDDKKVLTAGNGVTVDTAQTISGNKNFTGQTTFLNHSLLAKNTTVDLLHSTDSSWVGAGITGADKNNVRIGFIDFFVGTNDCSFKVFCRNRQDVEKEVFYTGINQNGAYAVVDNRHIVRTVNGVGANQAGNVTISTVANATKATNNASGNELSNNIIKGLSVSGKTITYTKLDGSTGTITTQDTNTWTALKGSTTSANGTAGYVPAPTKGAANRYLRCDGTWQVPPDTNTTYSKLSQFTNDSGFITSSGSCANATKATQDSAGQQINTTYIKNVSVSGRTITFTRGNGTTFAITIDTASSVVNKLDSSFGSTAVGGICFVSGRTSNNIGGLGATVAGSDIHLVNSLGFQVFASDDRVEMGRDYDTVLSGTWKLLGSVGDVDYKRWTLAIRIA